MRRWKFIKEKIKATIPHYLGETMVKTIGKERGTHQSVQPEVTIVGNDVTTSSRNKTVSPSISYQTGVA